MVMISIGEMVTKAAVQMGNVLDHLEPIGDYWIFLVKQKGVSTMSDRQIAGISLIASFALIFITSE